VENELEGQKKESVFCLLVFLCATSVWILLVALWEQLGRPLSEKIMTAGVELIAVIMMTVILKFTRLDIRKMGVTKKNLKPSLIRAGIISAAAIAVMVLFKIITAPGEHIFNWSEFEAGYLLTSVFQEFLSRGFLVTTLVCINTSVGNRHIAVLCSSLLFTSLHLYYGFSFMVGAGLLSVLLGYCYLKDENIWGVSIIHYVIGMAGLILEIV